MNVTLFKETVSAKTEGQQEEEQNQILLHLNATCTKKM